MPHVHLPLGEIEYEDTGGDGPPIVFLHGLAMDGSLWRHVVADLKRDFRCLVPVMPVGGHRIPIPPDRALSPRSVALMIGDFIEALGLQAPTVVENDGGRAQTLAAERPDLVGRLVLISCEAFDNYPPGLAGKVVKTAAQIPGGLTAMISALRFRPFRRLPTAFGQMSKRPIPDAVTDVWLTPLLTSAEIRRDLRRYLLAAEPDEMNRAAAGLRDYPGPALVVWAREDLMMPPAHGRRLAELIPHARLVEIDDCYTLIPEDRPDDLILALRTFLGSVRAAA